MFNMSQMKKIFTDWQENEPSCNSDVFLNKYIKKMKKRDKEERKILCPNCTKNRLVRQVNRELKCDVCFQEFIQIDAKTIRYK
jgi:hypothetical protein